MAGRREPPHQSTRSRERQGRQRSKHRKARALATRDARRLGARLGRTPARGEALPRSARARKGKGPP